MREDIMYNYSATVEKMHEEAFSMRVFSAENRLDSACCEEIYKQFQQHGAVHVIHTGLQRQEELLNLMHLLGGFGSSNQFQQGGRTSELWQTQWAAPGLRRMDYYPPHLYLLPNNEIQYQRYCPERVLLFCTIPPKTGGRTFLHDATQVERHIASQKGGEQLLHQLSTYGMTFITGFLDQHHPYKKNNYFQSWQERFQTQDKKVVLNTCLDQADRYDSAWWNDDNTLMTQITLPAFIVDTDRNRYLRFPRIALDPPHARNGYRQFLLGNGSALTEQDVNILLHAYLITRQGIDWSLGDIILMDNIRYGHSREAYNDNREILVGMAGFADVKNVYNPIWQQFQSNDHVLPRAKPVRSHQEDRYQLPPSQFQWEEKFSMRVFDAKGNLTKKRLLIAKQQFDEFGVLQIINTGIQSEPPGILPNELLDILGFGDEEQFQWGGMTCGRTQLKYLSKSMRETDHYPQDKFLLPHNEILYQRFMPERLLFFCHKSVKKYHGGRTFIHDALFVEQFIAQAGSVGQALLKKIQKHGYLIETGFLDENHPEKKNNYFRSWQDRLETTSREEALTKCKQSIFQFDECFWKTEEIETSHHQVFYTLMTRITIPGYKKDNRDGKRYLLFPRIALNGPLAHNGYRRFPLGNGDELNPEEITILLHAFWHSRQGNYYSDSDILLVDNIRFGHARESFSGDRMISASMAGLFWTDDVPKQE